MQIVIAWTEETQEIVKIGRVDLGESHKFRTVLTPKACMWVNKGNARDLAKARVYAANEGHAVLCYENEHNPLEKAKIDIMAV
jgi:hypothetical protein